MTATFPFSLLVVAWSMRCSTSVELMRISCFHRGRCTLVRCFSHPPPSVLMPTCDLRVQNKTLYTRGMPEVVEPAAEMRIIKGLFQVLRLAQREALPQQKALRSGSCRFLSRSAALPCWCLLAAYAM